MLPTSVWSKGRRKEMLRGEKRFIVNVVWFIHTRELTILVHFVEISKTGVTGLLCLHSKVSCR
jgi:hypothetical protein